MLLWCRTSKWRARPFKEATSKSRYWVAAEQSSMLILEQLGIQSHMTIFVTFEDSSDEQNDENLYLVDVGFGRACIPQPMPLRKFWSRVLTVSELI